MVTSILPAWPVAFEPLAQSYVVTLAIDSEVKPEAFQAYLIKSECFCFKEQTLESGESQIFTMVFYIDPSIDSDWYFDNLKELSFTYEFSEYKS